MQFWNVYFCSAPEVGNNGWQSLLEINQQSRQVTCKAHSGPWILIPNEPPPRPHTSSLVSVNYGQLLCNPAFGQGLVYLSYLNN